MSGLSLAFLIAGLGARVSKHRAAQPGSLADELFLAGITTLPRKLVEKHKADTLFEYHRKVGPLPLLVLGFFRGLLGLLSLHRPVEWLLHLRGTYPYGPHEIWFLFFQAGVVSSAGFLHTTHPLFAAVLFGISGCYVLAFMLYIGLTKNGLQNVRVEWKSLRLLECPNLYSGELTPMPKRLWNRGLRVQEKIPGAILWMEYCANDPLLYVTRGLFGRERVYLGGWDTGNPVIDNV